MTARRRSILRTIRFSWALVNSLTVSSLVANSFSAANSTWLSGTLSVAILVSEVWVAIVVKIRLSKKLGLPGWRENEGKTCEPLRSFKSRNSPV